MICDRSIVARVKWKVYKMVLRHAMMYSLELVAPTKVGEKMLIFSLDKIRN